MKSLIVILFFSICLGLDAQKSYIQVTSESGLTVFLDGAFKGKTTSDIGGLIIENVSPGAHIIKVVKAGFNPQEENISIKEGEVFSYKVRPFSPEVVISQQGNTETKEIDLQVGEILIQSLPINIGISIPKLGLKDAKIKDEWHANKIPIGRYDVTFFWNDKTLNYSFGIKPDKTTQLFVNMISGVVEDRTPEEPVWVNVNYGTYGDFHTVQIGSQTWFEENLHPTLKTELEGLRTRNGKVETIDGFYRWEIANRACPTGWHLPSLPEWNILINYLGGIDKASRKMIRHDPSESPIANNIVFNAFPNGMWSPFENDYTLKGTAAFFWTSTENNEGVAFAVEISPNNDKIEIVRSTKSLEYNVRCIKN